MKSKKIKFSCTLCFKDKEEKHPYFLRTELKGDKPLRSGVCTQCLRLTRKRNKHYYR